jgi:exopolyphosphatase
MAPTNHTIQLALLLKEGTAGIGAAAAATVPSAERRRVRLVMGNESADLDSVVCSVVYAHWLSLTHAAARTSVSSPRSAVGTSAAVAPGAVSPVLICPVINVPRRDLPLRTDVKWMLDRVSIDLNHLVYIDDPDVVALALHSGSLADLDVVLVDHNVLLPLWEGHASTVVEIIDHHEDTQLYVPQLGLCPLHCTADGS